MILDTAFLVELLREAPDAFEKGAKLAEDGRAQRLPAPVLYELRYGVEMHGDADERRAVRNLPRLYPVVRLDDRMAAHAGVLMAAADETAGGPGASGIDDVDAMVAAVADTVDEPVLTRNVEDFERLGVAVETW